MSDRDALYAAILAHPDEDTPRLVFADWLEENGDAEHAAFIRRQIEQAKVPEWDPCWIRAWRPNYEVSHGWKWTAPKLPAPLEWAGGGTHRGFPGVVAVQDGQSFVEQLPTAFRLAPLCKLEWWGSRTNQVNGWGMLPHWKLLMNSVWLARFHSVKLPLVWLTLDELSALEDSPHATNLSELDLMTCSFDHDHAATLFKGKLIRRLKQLALHIRDGGTSDVVAAAGCVVNHGLESLRIGAGRNHARSSLLWETDFLHTPLFRGLKELDLSDNLIDTHDLRQLANWDSLRGVESLQLKWCRFGTPDASSLIGSATLVELRRLVLDNNDLGPETAEAIAKAPHLRHLTVLSLERNPIGDSGARAIARSAHLTQLLELNLRDCHVGDVGAQAILDSPLSENLERLSLGLSEIKPAMKGKLRKRMGSRVVL